MITQAGRCIENQFVHVSIEQNGTLTLLDKTTGQEFEELLTFEDVGDIGNEYIFKQPENEQVILSKTNREVLLRSSRIHLKSLKSN